MPRMEGRGCLPVKSYSGSPPATQWYPVQASQTIKAGHRLCLSATSGSVYRASVANTAAVGFAAAAVSTTATQRTTRIPVFVNDGVTIFQGLASHSGATAADWRRWLGDKGNFVTNSGATAFHRLAATSTRKSYKIVGVNPDDIGGKTTTGARLWIQLTPSGSQYGALSSAEVS